MAAFRDLPISRKLTRTNLIVSLSALLFVCIAFTAYEVTTFKKRAVKQLLTDADLIGLNVTPALLFNDERAAAETLATLRSIPNIVSAAVYTKDGRRFAKYVRDPRASTIPPPRIREFPNSYRIDGSDLMVTRRVASEGKPAGVVYINSDLTEVSRRLLSYGAIGFSVLAASLIMSLVVSSALQRRIVEPMLSLAETARTVAVHHDYSVRATVRSKDETGILADAFNEMLRQIEQQNDTAQQNAIEIRQINHEIMRIARDRQLLLDSTGDGIYAVDAQLHCTMANRVAMRLLGRTPEELMGQTIHDLIHHQHSDGSPYPNEECPVHQTLVTGSSYRVTDDVFWRSDGTCFPVEYVTSPIIDDHVVRGVVITFSDVTERRRLERRVEQLDRVNSLGRMAATIAHEFNNVLMGIQPFAEVLRKTAGGNHTVQTATTHILGSVNRGRGITQDILKMTRTPEPQLQSVDVPEWLEPLAAEIRAMAGTRIDVRLDVPPAGSLFARFDPAQMQQVVTNIALNARDAMPRGGMLTISARAAADGVRIEITDTGHGIPPDALPFIFEPLFTTKHSGTGLGLAVAQQLVIRSGGTINVESAAGEGTRFSIDFPAAAPSVVTHPSAEPLEHAHASVRRVLIVEDDPAVASGLACMLESENVDVRVVNLGREAAHVVAMFHPDVVLIDVSLPDIDGTEVYRELTKQWPDIGVIFSTGHADESRLPDPNVKHVGFLRKPYSTETLLSKIREVV